MNICVIVCAITNLIAMIQVLDYTYQNRPDREKYILTPEYAKFE